MGVHMSCMDLCQYCDRVICIMCLTAHLAGECPKLPEVVDAGGDAASYELTPACLGNKGKVTSAIEVLARDSPFFKDMFYDPDAEASSSDGGPGGKLKSNRRRIADPVELRALTG